MDETDGRATGSPLAPATLHAVFDVVDEAVFVHAPDGRILDVNRAAAELYGYSRAELRDSSVATVCSGAEPYTRATAEARIEEAAQGTPQEFGWEAQSSDGTVFQVTISLRRVPVDDADRVVATVRDVDDRRATTRRFQTLIDNLPGVVYRCRNEPGWPMEFVGGRCASLTGYDADAIESGDVSWGADLIHPADRERVDQAVQTALETDSPFEVTYRIQTADGDERWVWERGKRLANPGDGPGMLEGFITDITRQKRSERRLAEQRDDLEVLNQVLRHDIRNDLQLITAGVDAVEEHCDGPEVREEVELLRESAEHAVALTRTAREMSAVMLSTDEELRPVALRPVLETELDDVRAAYPDAVVTTEGPVPDVDVRANELLGSVFRNVLKNAVQHNDKQVPEVTVAAEADADDVTVRVADNGPGIPDEHEDEIFGKGETGLESSGAGLGLYLVRTLVEGYGGQVRVEDNDPEGAVFVLTLPAAE